MTTSKLLFEGQPCSNPCSSSCSSTRPLVFQEGDFTLHATWSIYIFATLVAGGGREAWVLARKLRAPQGRLPRDMSLRLILSRRVALVTLALLGLGLGALWGRPTLA